MKNDWIMEQYVKETYCKQILSEDSMSQREKLIQRGSCCGKTCKECPYDPPYVFGSNVIKPLSQ